MASCVTAPFNHPMPRTVLLVLRLISNFLHMKVLIRSIQTPFSISSICFFSIWATFLFQPRTFRKTLGAITLHSSRVSPTAKVSQAGNCIPASRSSQQTAAARPWALIPRACTTDLLLPSLIHVINPFAFPTRPGPRACRRGGKLMLKFHLLHFESDVKWRLLLLAQHFCHLSPDPQPCRRADAWGLMHQDPCWHRSHINGFLSASSEVLSLNHLLLVDNSFSPFPRRSSVGHLVAQHQFNSEFVQRLVVLTSLIPSFGHLQKDVKKTLAFSCPCSRFFELGRSQRPCPTRSWLAQGPYWWVFWAPVVRYCPWKTSSVFDSTHPLFPSLSPCWLLFPSLLQQVLLSMPQCSMLQSIPNSSSRQNPVSCCHEYRLETSNLPLPPLSPWVTASSRGTFHLDFKELTQFPGSPKHVEGDPCQEELHISEINVNP